MTKKATKSVFSVAMSKETGCLVMIRTNGKDVTVIGSLDKEQSDGLAQGIIDWESPEPTPGEVLEAAAEEGTRTVAVYPH